MFRNKYVEMCRQSALFKVPQTMSIFEQNVLIQAADMSIVSKYNNFELKQMQSIFDMTALPKSILSIIQNKKQQKFTFVSFTSDALQMWNGNEK